MRGPEACVATLIVYLDIKEHKKVTGLLCYKIHWELKSHRQIRL